MFEENDNFVKEKTKKLLRDEDEIEQTHSDIKELANLIQNKIYKEMSGDNNNGFNEKNEEDGDYLLLTDEEENGNPSLCLTDEKKYASSRSRGTSSSMEKSRKALWFIILMLIGIAYLFYYFDSTMLAANANKAVK